MLISRPQILQVLDLHRCYEVSRYLNIKELSRHKLLDLLGTFRFPLVRQFLTLVFWPKLCWCHLQCCLLTWISGSFKSGTLRAGPGAVIFNQSPQVIFSRVRLESPVLCSTTEKIENARISSICLISQAIDVRPRSRTHLGFHLNDPVSSNNIRYIYWTN